MTSYVCFGRPAGKLNQSLSVRVPSWVIILLLQATSGLQWSIILHNQSIIACLPKILTSHIHHILSRNFKYCGVMIITWSTLAHEYLGSRKWFQLLLWKPIDRVATKSISSLSEKGFTNSTLLLSPVSWCTNLDDVDYFLETQKDFAEIYWYYIIHNFRNYSHWGGGAVG